VLQPKLAMEIAREHHLRSLSFRHLQLLAFACGGGMSNRQIGTVLGLTEGVVRRSMGELHAIICVPIGCDRKDAMSATWFWLHTECCVAAALRMMEKGIA
jgi:hypothetical protein